ncbi:MAG: 4-hydroxy-3-methylbut-2-enyl diphosphate reductase [Spirochaetales bacterium]|nr:4-hydroxy-3-methylbut-2-enyl diphosphate reductase [Spirochaetales bacterium]
MVMEVLCPTFSGFCPGVKRAEKRILKVKEDHPTEKIFTIGNLINNLSYIRFLKEKNIITVNDDDISGINHGSIVAIRTHGIDRRIEAALHEHFDVIDLTCGNVKKVQLKIKDYSDRGFYIIITGKRKHPEIIGLKSYARESSIIETDEDLDLFCRRDIPSHVKKIGNPLDVFIVSQTTGDRSLFENTVKQLDSRFGWVGKKEWFDSICPVTSRKAAASCKLQKKTDVTFVVGDRLSSNTFHLYKTLKKEKKDVFFIEKVDDVDAAHIPAGKYRKALVISSASTPCFVEKEICEYLKSVK